MKTLLVAAFLLLGSALANAQATIDPPSPFGFKLGQTRSQILASLPPNCIKTDKGDLVVLNTAPVPNSRFEYYIVLISRTKGLVKVVASGKKVKTGDNGADLREEFDHIKDALVGKYGTATNTFDFVHSGQSDQPQFFMLNLLQSNASLTYAWDLGDTKILLRANASGINEGYVSLSYEFSNEMDVWSAEHEQKDNASY